jgi:hypothetical protein
LLSGGNAAHFECFFFSSFLLLLKFVVDRFCEVKGRTDH